MSRAVIVGPGFRSFIDQARANVGRAVDEATDRFVDRAQGHVPVRTGALRDSIAANQRNDLESAVVVGAEYGIYVHNGTRDTSAHPFLIAAAEDEAPEFARGIADALAGLS